MSCGMCPMPGLLWGTVGCVFLSGIPFLLVGFKGKPKGQMQIVWGSPAKTTHPFEYLLFVLHTFWNTPAS